MAKRPNPQREQFWRSTIGQWKQSGLSIRAFCARRQLTQASFYAWRRELAKRDQAGSPTLKFLPIHLRADPLLEIALPDGLVVRAPAAIEPTAVAALVRALRATSC
jgi:transposase